MAEDKLSWSELRHALAQRAGVTEKVANTFLNALNAQLIEALKQDKQVKINGLGTFRLQAVAPRKSVNVTTGEAITIEGYNKISFSAEAGVKEMIERTQSKSTAKSEVAALVETVTADPLKKLSEQADEIIDILADLGQAPNEEEKGQVDEAETSESEAKEEKQEVPQMEESAAEESQSEPIKEEVAEEQKQEGPIAEEKQEEPKEEETAVVPEFPNNSETEIEPIQESETPEEKIIIRPVIVKHVEPVIGRGVEPMPEKAAEPAEPISLETPAATPTPATQSFSSISETPIEQSAPTIPSTPSAPYVPSASSVPTAQSTPSMPSTSATQYSQHTQYTQSTQYTTASKPAAPKQEEPKKKESHFFRNLLVWLLILLLLAGAGYLLLRHYGMSGWIDSYIYGTQNATIVQPADTIVAADTIADSKDSIESEPKEEEMQFEKIKYRYIKTERMHRDSRLIWMSKRYYGDKAYWPYLYDANRDRIINPDQVEVGTPIRVPKLTRELRDTTIEHTRLRLRALRREAEAARNK